MNEVNSQDTHTTQLRRTEKRFHSLVENVSDIIAMVDATGIILYASPSVERTLGYKPEELIGTNAFALVHPDDLAQVRAVFESILASPNVTGPLVESRSRHKNGSWRNTEVIGKSITDDLEPYVVMSLRDITEKKQLEVQFRRAQRMESIGTLAGGIAHDLNNILAPILMIMPVLREEILRREVADMLEMLEQSTRRGANMVQQILTFSRGVKTEREPIQTRHLLKEFAGMIVETFPKSITLNLSVPTNLWLVQGNVTELHQALMNLCINARDAMPKGGTLTVAAENVILDKIDASMIPNARAGPYVVWLIADTGEGIAPENLGRIFDPFFTTKAHGKGTGLGLSTTIGIIRGHDGCVQVQSEPGKGSAFKVYLPATSQLPQPKEARQTSIRRGQGELILVVDDEDAIRRVTESILAKYNYSVMTARDGAEAVEIFSRNLDKIDLVIIDMMMPVMDGRTATNLIRKLKPSAKIIFSSGFASKAARAELPSARADATLTKPFLETALLETVQTVLAGEK